MQGIARAFRHPEIIDLIGRLDGVAVTLFQWSSQVNERYVIPWHLLKDPASISTFAAKVARTKRDPMRGFTAIGRAIDYGIDMIAQNPFEGRHLKIDVAGDGRNNTGIAPANLGLQIDSHGIVVNGLPILTRAILCGEGLWHLPVDERGCAPGNNLDGKGLVKYYRENVIQGPGAFVEIATEYDDFARAFLQKLLRELAPQVSREHTIPTIKLTRAQQPDIR